MSINLYLDENKVINLAGFSDVPYKSGGGGGIRFNHLALYKDKGRLYAMLNDSDKMPEMLEGFVIDVSMYDNFGGPHIARRELGVYREGDSTVELSLTQGGKENHYHVKATGKNLEETRALIQKIKAGTIRPTESHEAPQSGKSRDDLEQELDHLKDIQAEDKANLETFKERKRELYYFVAKLDYGSRWWCPWISKAKIVGQINAILNGGSEK